MVHSNKINFNQTHINQKIHGSPKNGEPAATPRTDAQKKGDWLDCLLKYPPPVDELMIGEYPPDVQDVLKVFLKLFPLENYPTRPVGKTGGVFAQWITECRALKKSCGAHDVEKMLTEAQSDWIKNPWTVDHPGAVIKNIRSKIAYNKVTQKPVVNTASEWSQDEIAAFRAGLKSRKKGIELTK
jgi:hypothetical protein